MLCALSVDTQPKETLLYLPALREKTTEINPCDKCLSNPDGGLLGADSVIVIGRVSLTIFGANGFVVAHIDSLEVSSVSFLECFLVLAADSLEDSVGGGNGFALLALVLGSGECTRVEQDEGVLFVGNGGKVTLGNRALQGGNSGSELVSCSLDGGLADGSIGGGHTGHGNDTGGGSDSTKGRSAIHVQGGGGTLQQENESIQ